MSRFFSSGQTGGGLHGLVKIAVIHTTLWKLTIQNEIVARIADQQGLRKLGLPYLLSG